MTAILSFEEWNTRGRFAPYVQEARTVTSTPVWMFDFMQPAGDFPDPPLDEMVVIQDRARSIAIADYGAGRFRFEPGGLSIVPARSGTEITCDNAHNIRVLGFKPEQLNGWVEADQSKIDLGHLHASTLHSAFVHSLMDRIWDTGLIEGGASALYGDAALLILWVELLREAKAAPLKPVMRGGLAPWQQRRCTDYLNDHASDNIGLEELAALVGLSPFHFARAFKQSTGVPPHRFQLALRITRAKAQLVATELPVTQIAFDVGYESSQALARLFRREVGMSPSDYRRTHRL